MNLFDILANAQGGNGLGALGKQFGLSPQQTQSAVEALMPAFSQGLKQNASDPYGMGAFMSALASGQHAKYVENPAAAFTPQGVAEGNSILGHLFGSKDLSRAVAAQASQATGIGTDTLKQMLPALASMVMGGLFKQTNNQMAAGGFGGQGSNPLGDLIEQMMRQGGAAQQAPQRAPSGGDNPFGKMLEGMLGGGQAQQAPQGNPMGPLGDILGQILGGGAGQAQQPQQRRAPQGGSGNPLEDILGQVLGGGQASGRAAPRGGSGNPLEDILGQVLGGGQGRAQPQQYEEPAPQPQRRGQAQQRQRNPLEDIFGQMVEPGRQVNEQYQQGVNDIFEQFRRGVKRHG